MNAFKYLKRQHASELVKSGALRLGTLYEYREIEKHGTEVGDAKEGVVTQHTDGPVVMNEENRSKYGTNNVAFNGFQIFAKGGVQTDRHSQDMYIYSMAASFNEQAMRVFQYDACVEISDVEMFIGKITESLEDRIKKHLGIYRCVYGEKVIPHGVELPCEPALLKAEEYAYQNEIRAIWAGRDVEIVPIIVSVPQVRDLCSIYVA